jgi:hypothetical protein
VPRWRSPRHAAGPSSGGPMIYYLGGAVIAVVLIAALIAYSRKGK